ncbi:MAG: T9SS type A sorting domain-containing protein [Bacteroidia bacterium]
MRKVILHYLFNILLLLLFTNSYSQNGDYEYLIGASGDESNYACYKTFDNGYILTGLTNSSGAGEGDIYLLKLDSAFNIEWAKTFGGPLSDFAEHIQQTADSSFVIFGTTQSFGAGGLDCYIIKTDQQGNLLWSKTYGGADDDKVIKGLVLNDGSILLPAFTNSFGAGGDMMLIKLDVNGDTLWTRIIGGADFDFATSVNLVNNGNYIFSGRSISYGAGNRDAVLLETDSNGNLQWMKTYGTLNLEEAMYVRQTMDNGFIITGDRALLGFYHDALLMKTDSAGNLQWAKEYGGDKVDATYNVLQLPDSGFAMVGFTDSYASLAVRFENPNSILGDDSSHVLLIRTNQTGDTIFSRAYGGSLGDEAYSIEMTNNGGFLIGAYSFSFSGNDSSDIYVIKTDSNGISDCHTKFISPVITNLSFSSSNVFPSITSGVIVNNAPTISGNPILANTDPCIPVSIFNSHTKKLKIQIFPNPFSYDATLSFPALENSVKNAYLTIYDLSGRILKNTIVSENELSSGNLKISSDGLVNGVYFFELKINSEYPLCGKFIITDKE